VAAPIMPRGRVLGFLHADCYFSGRDVDELDRDTLWAFAEGYGYAMDRALLMHRLHALTREVRHVAEAADALTAEQDGTDVGLAHADDLAASVVATTASIVAPQAPLTAREREVLEHMAAGQTNAAIAGELVIAEETVKSHVKQILRKLQAANRAEAVSRYMQLGRG
jgi:DNA-binding NarL/FixJ family response regulator